MRRTARGLLAAVVTAVAMLFALALPTHAESPVDIPPGSFVVDNSGVLGGGEANELEEEISKLRSETGVSLFVVFVDQFSNPQDPQQWAADVAERKNMGSNDTILAVATEQRQAQFLTSQSGPLGGAGQQIYTQYIAPELNNLDWLAAAEGAINGIEDAARGTGSRGGSSGSGFSLVPILLVFAGVAVIGYFVLSRRSKKQVRRGQAQPNQPVQPAIPLDQLRKQADHLLVAADDSIRSSEQELGFAEAQYGSAAIATFTQDLSKAKEHLRESFKLQQQLDDEIPDTEEEQRSWLNEIIRRCQEVNSSLEAHAADFKSLRKLETNAESHISELEAGLEPLNQRLSQSVALLEDLSQRYAPEATSQVLDNASQTSERISFIRSALNQARTAIQNGERSQAAVLVQNAEEAHDQATGLLDAIAKSNEALTNAEADLRAAVAEAEQELSQAKALMGAQGGQRLAAPIAALETALESVKRSMRQGKPNPLALIAALDEAGQPLSNELGTLREKDEQERHARSQLQSVLRTAESRINGTDDYIRARRGGVRSSARTRLAEARRCHEDAVRLSGSDPIQALATAQRAIRLAEEAARMAESDVDSFGGPGGYGGYGQGRRGPFDGLGGAVLGGILIDSILHGGRSSGGHSDGGFFGGGGFGGFGGGGGGFGGGGGGFGGGGGGFSGGGGSF